MPVALVALGGNLCDRAAELDRAVARLRAEPHLRLVAVSAYYATDPVDAPPGSPEFLNAACALDTELPPERVLEILLRIERQLGRARSLPNAPRVIDLDLLLVGDQTRHTAELTLPHPRLHERAFVLVPLAEIAPDFVHPILGRTVRDLLNDLSVERTLPRRFEHPLTDPYPELAGLRAVVTGSSGGIGLAIARAFASAGAAVMVHGSRPGDKLEAALADVRNRTDDAHAVAADLADAAACDRLAADAWAWRDGIDIWVNNAGADTLTGAAAGWDFDHKWEALFSIDVKATVRLSRSVGERMKRRGRGVIVNMGWDQAEAGIEGDSGQLFAASKAAVMAFSRALAVSLAPEVRVNCLAPGWVRTAWGETASPDWQQRVADETPLGRWGLPEDVAEVARWLASPRSAFITGETIRVGGGVVRV